MRFTSPPGPLPRTSKDQVLFSQLNQHGLPRSRQPVDLATKPSGFATSSLLFRMNTGKGTLGLAIHLENVPQYAPALYFTDDDSGN